jgi:hypothetical protein
VPILPSRRQPSLPATGDGSGEFPVTFPLDFPLDLNLRRLDLDHGTMPILREWNRVRTIDANLFLAPGEGGKEPEAEEKPRIAAGAGAAPPTAASLLRGGIA